MDKKIALARNLIVGLLIILAFIFALSISSSSISVISFWKAFGVEIILLVISAIVISAKQYRDDFYGIPKKTIALSFIVGLAIGFAYVFLTSLIPGLALAVPLVPNSIGSTSAWFLVNILAPIAETIFFLGALLAYLQQFQPTRKHLILALVIDSVLFALFHLGAYITGFYDYSALQGFSAFSSNVSLFISAFIFNMVAGFLVISKRFRNLLVAMVMHAVINFSAYTKAIVVFG